MRGSHIARFLFDSVLHSLRRQFAFALMLLTAIMLAYGVSAIYTLHHTSAATRELAEQRLARLQTGQDLVWQTIAAARYANQWQESVSAEQAQASYADLVRQLNRIDHLVESINNGDNALGVLDLQYADQLFIATANTLVQQRGILAHDRQAFDLSYQRALTLLQRRTGLTRQRAQAILFLTTTTNDLSTVRQLRLDFQHLPGDASSWKDPILDPFAMRIALIERIGIIGRLEDVLQQQSFRMMDAAREQSDYFTADYRVAIHQLTDTTQRQQYWVAAFLTGSLLVAWMIGYLFLGRLVLGRLAVISRHLRQPRMSDPEPHVPVSGHDEIAGMARAVERLFEDRNQLHRAQLALQASESRLSAIIQYAADSFVIVQDGVVRQLNPAAQRLLGWQPGDVPRLERSDLRASSEAAAHYDTMAYRNDGEAIPVEVSLSEVTLLTGPVRILVIRDARLRRETERQLTAARDAAEAARSAQAAFLANMSHEFRTPLNAILGYAQILQRDESLSERQRRGLSTIEQSGEHLLLLVNDILDLAQIEAGRLELFPSQVDMQHFLHVISDIIVVKAEQKSLLFHCDIPESLPPFVGADEKRLRQVLLNLLGNAVKFTSRGYVNLHVHWQAQGADVGILRFEIEDSGVGIPEHQIEHIFERFIQVGDTSKRLSGTGLGLPISRHIVQLMGGDLKVRSQPGKGSVFWFDLSLPYSEHGPAVLRQRPVIGYRGARRRVLVIDDGEDNRSMLEAMLTELGFDVATARDGQAGVACARSARPDLIVMDAMMPVLDGQGAVRQIRALPELAGVPILMVSADVTLENQHTASNAGADAFLSKPLRQEELIRQLSGLLGLEWDYAAQDNRAPRDNTLQPPPRQDLAALYELAQLGDLQQIRQYAAELIQRDEHYRSFAERLEKLAAELRSKAVLQLIQQFIDKETP